jgi:hypothetical protein
VTNKSVKVNNKKLTAFPSYLMDLLENLFSALTIAFHCELDEDIIANQLDTIAKIIGRDHGFIHVLECFGWNHSFLIYGKQSIQRF